mmetsp:Transcript_24656/g.51168  ORF Transcript_24656/g.51168 Transcript_24656/m.51168 type:complete len:266 (+) Transcript_24656:94-891(+)
MRSSNYSSYLRSLDAHSPISSEFRIRTLSGATLSLLTLLLTVYLITKEYSYNLSTTFLSHVHVMPQSPDGLEVEFDISFPHIPCALLAVDANDPTGQSQSFHIDKRHRVWKHRLDKRGKTIGRKSRFELGNTLIREDQLDSLQKAKEQQKNQQSRRTTTQSRRKFEKRPDPQTAPPTPRRRPLRTRGRTHLRLLLRRRLLSHRMLQHLRRRQAGLPPQAVAHSRHFQDRAVSSPRAGRSRRGRGVQHSRIRGLVDRRGEFALCSR